MRASLWSRLLMLLALLLTQVLTVSVVLWSDRVNAERVMRTQAAERLGQLTSMSAENILAHLRTATQLVTLNASSVRSGQLSTDDPARLSLAFQAMLNAMPQLNGVLIGQPDGRFTLVRRDGADNSGRFIRHIETQPIRQVTTTILDARGQVTARSSADDPLDPRTRAWYRLARQTPEQTVWTEPYVFASSRQPGITVARALLDSPGGPVVLGVDIELRHLATVLQGARFSPHGRAFVTDGAGHAIATSLAWPAGPGAQVPMLADVADPALRGLLRGWSGGPFPVGASHYSVDGQPYTAEIRELEVQPGVRWMIGVYAPDADFIAGLQGSYGPRLLSILLACLLSGLLAWPLLARAVRPMKTLQQQATTDPLTGLRNRAGFLAQLDEALSTPRDGTDRERQLGVAIFDLDGFKSVNDTYGHAVGDEVLLAVGARLLAAARPGDTVGRLGGDEFALLVDGASREEVLLRVEGVLAAVARRPVVVESLSLPIQSTAGLAFHDPDEPLTAPHPRTRLLARADAALIGGKRREKGRVWVDGHSTMSTIFI